MLDIDTIQHQLHRTLVIAVFGPIWIVGVITFGILDGREGIEQSTAEFRKLIP